jgi:pSer/pThr/pTyr-binding forkhead associated (FHA) protein
MAYVIRVQSGAEKGEIYPLFENREITIGRSPTNNIAIRDKNISRVHCQIVVSDGRCVLTDLQSTNGTFVNDQRVVECGLKPKDEIRVGVTLLRLEETGEREDAISETKLMM